MIDRCVIKDNYVASVDSVSDKCAIGVTMSGGTMINCAVVGNYCRGRNKPSLGAVYASETAKVINTLIADNRFGDGVDMPCFGAASYYQNCAMTTPGEAESSVDIAKSTDHYFIKDGVIPAPFSGSALINSGTITDTPAMPLVDINHNLIPGNAVLDIGPVEYISGTLEIVSPAYHALDSLEATLIAKCDRDLTGALYSWDIDSDGVADYTGANLAQIIHTYKTLGAHTATLTVKDATTEDVIATARQEYTIDPATLYVNPASTAPTAPYATWETAAHTIHEVVAAATAGSTVIITNGTYTYPNSTYHISLTKPITVRSFENDPTTVEIDANSKGPALGISHHKAVLSGVTVSNGAQGNGYSGVKITTGGGTLTNCVVRGCRSNNWGGEGNNVWNQNGYVVDCVITKGTSGNSQRGLGLYQKGADAVTERCVITENYISTANATLSTIGAHIAGGALRSSHIYGNYITDASAKTAACGLAVHVENGAVMENCTVENNFFRSVANEYTYGVYAASGATVRNCVILGNGSTDGDTTHNWGGDAAAYINCYTTNIGDLPEGNIDADLCPNAYLNKDDILSLPVGSPLIDAGAAVAETHIKDLNGDKRAQGKGPDIGCVEYEPQPLAVSFTPEADAALDRLTTTLTANAEGDLEGITYSWDINGDGEIDHTGRSVNIDLTTIGTHKITLTAVNTAGNTSSFTWEFNVNPSTLYVNPSSTAPTAPYATWETAAHTILEAISAATDGATVIITNGNYTYNSTTRCQINLTKPITVRSYEDDPETVIINAGWQYGVCGAVIQHTGATLSGVTLTRGRCEYGKGGCQILGGGTLRNSIVKGNGSCNWDGMGCGVYNLGGTVIGCIITGNYGGNPARGYGLYQSGASAITDQCIITNNNYGVGGSRAEQYMAAGASVNGGVIRNTLIATNTLNLINSKNYTVASGLYLAAGATAENCAILDNPIYPYEGTEYAGLHTSGGTVINTLIAGNNYTNGTPANCVTTAASVWKNNCTTGAKTLPGENNVELTATTYSLNENKIPVHTTRSPLFNAGLPTAAKYDLLGQPRTHGRRPDIGVWELQKSAGLFIILK